MHHAPSESRATCIELLELTPSSKGAPCNDCSKGPCSSGARVHCACIEAERLELGAEAVARGRNPGPARRAAQREHWPGARSRGAGPRRERAAEGRQGRMLAHPPTHTAHAQPSPAHRSTPPRRPAVPSPSAPLTRCGPPSSPLGGGGWGWGHRPLAWRLGPGRGIRGHEHRHLVSGQPPYAHCVHPRRSGNHRAEAREPGRAPRPRGALSKRRGCEAVAGLWGDAEGEG